MKENKLSVIYMLIDLLLLNLSVIAVYDFWEVTLAYRLSFYILQANFAWIITAYTFNQKNPYLRDSYHNRFLTITKKVTVFFIFSLAFSFLFMKMNVSRLYILVSVALFWALEVITYWIAYSVLYYRRRKGIHVKKLLLIGYTDTSKGIKELITDNLTIGYKFIGYVKYDNRTIDDIPEEDQALILGNVSDLENIVKENNAEVLFSVFSFYRDEANIGEYLKIANNTGTRLYVVFENQRWLGKNSDVETLGDYYMVNPQHIPLDDIDNRIMKRAFDIVFSSIVLICLSWFFILIAILIKLSSKGPIFFKQERTGLNNKTFMCYKFRSMKVNVDADRMQATKNDCRITPLGKFLRKSNIDELPQFWNVFLGQMSVVGPRPHMLCHTTEYSSLVHCYMVRHYVKPGITGLAQVNGFRGETNELWKMERRVKLDMKYIENWTFMWDIEIIWLTVFGKNVKKNAF
ncbi:MAG: undecaprenyl-phosphate glucose phosphotransferase [Culturomica sp.]|jgi:Undecaprenyl-phosphate glucose phosphotransferase|nr:undecaprenyl-phosphate glucose phosphotransferase [Culturomica sp.]